MSAELPYVSAIWRYPVKSMAGESLELARLDADGMRGDRIWAVRDEELDAIADARRNARLLGLTARYTRPISAADPVPPVEITLPDGRTFRSTDADAHELAAEILGRPATLHARRPAGDQAYYRRPAPEDGDWQTWLEQLFGVETGAELPDLGALPPVLWESQTLPGTHFDAFPLMAVTDRTLESLRKLSPGSDADVRRFRPNLVISVPEEVEGDFPELAWVGREVQIGTAVLRIESACPRCVMISHPVPLADLPADRALLRTVHAKTGHNVGVYASVVRPGVLGLDDAVAVR
ncbi:MOSC domain-containing protein [Yinghuangia soli]|uniref:MOSC domain-containing protein n=1 Tax=Yinghuangia soli TaxID=2908204 RepID=A0AA41PW92_9ACTN|nr:MOSC N-terminal beta barrel domain-containing protein [Yinghuangia soli]MCF2526777.1 MOSC domain-containing protein [Yinghuangia soli]